MSQRSLLLVMGTKREVRGGAFRIAAVAVITFAALVVVGCGTAVARPLGPPTASVSSTPISPRHVEARSARDDQAFQLQVVLDTSASVPPEYRLQALSGVASLVRGWPRPLPADGGSAIQTGLVVQIRGVSANSYAPESLLGTWSVHAIPAVQGLPNGVTADFTQRVITYKREHAAAVAAYRLAVSEARRAAMELRSLRPKTTYASEIEGAVSAATQSFSPSGIRRLIVVSDLAQNRPPQIAGDLRGVEVLIAHLCSNVSTCQSQERTWSRTLRARGARSVVFVRIERFAAAVAAFVRRR